jgi:hypothetical protein
MKSIIKYRLKKIIPNRIWTTTSGIRKNRKDNFFSETRKVFGKQNEDIEIFIIRRKPPGGGLFSNVNYVLQGLIYAKKREMYPVVDMQNYSTEYSRIRKFNGKKNAWEYFFNPVSNINLIDAYKSKNVTLSEGDRILKNHIMSGRNIAFVLDNDFLEESHKIYTKHIKLNNYTNSYIEYILKSKEIVPDSTLGVFLRGRDYLLGPTGHPIQPDIDDVVKDIIVYLETKPIEKLLLSTDDVQLRKKLEDKFGSLMIESIRSDSESLFSDELRNQFEIPKGAIARNLSYLSEIYILSKLSFNISSLSNGSAIMYVINGQKFTDSKLYYYGVN